MFHRQSRRHRNPPRFPRVRGDVPPGGLIRCQVETFSPRARGCSPQPASHHRRAEVFPACAGMFLDRALSLVKGTGFPRVRGDVPGCRRYRWRDCGFSPRARGCSGTSLWGTIRAGVFPACAGMFPLHDRPWKIRSGFPRVRGDVPFLFGCLRPNRVVFPACAGMFLSESFSPKISDCFPRVRGDVPTCAAAIFRHSSFSPRARGCSLHDDHPFCVCVVFPACAGMFLPRRGLGLSGSGFPRMRGDVPVTGLPTRLSALFSPRARGCS